MLRKRYVILIALVYVFMFCGCGDGGKTENTQHTEATSLSVITPTAVSTPRHNATPIPTMTPNLTPTVTPSPTIAPEIDKMADPYIGEFNNRKYLFLPTIGERVHIDEDEEPYISNISFDLVKEFEKEMLCFKDNENVENGPGFYFKIEDSGAFYLCAEVIEKKTPDPDDPFDHIHLSYKKRIDKNLLTVKNNKLFAEGNVISIKVSSLPEGLEYSFSGEETIDIINYISSLHLENDFEENPNEYGGLTWVIFLEYEDGDSLTIYHFGNMFIRSDKSPWYKMDYEEASRFEQLLNKLNYHTY
jgi:hypothetical protein